MIAGADKPKYKPFLNAAKCLGWKTQNETTLVDVLSMFMNDPSIPYVVYRVFGVSS